MNSSGSQGGTIIVEFAERPGVEQVSLTANDVVEKSSHALDRALTTIQTMAGRVSSTLSALESAPAEVELEFALKFDTEAGAIIAKAGVEAGLQVSVVWKRD